MKKSNCKQDLDKLVKHRSNLKGTVCEDYTEDVRKPDYEILPSSSSRLACYGEIHISSLELDELEHSSVHSPISRFFPHFKFLTWFPSSHPLGFLSITSFFLSI